MRNVTYHLGNWLPELGSLAYFNANSVPASDTLTFTCHFNMLWNERCSEDANFYEIIGHTAQFLVIQPVIFWWANRLFSEH
jgi:hypothetical protein